MPGLDPAIHRNKMAGESPPFFHLSNKTNRLPKRQLLRQDGFAVRGTNDDRMVRRFVLGDAFQK